jgi:uncharacterized membrane protein
MEESYTLYWDGSFAFLVFLILVLLIVGFGFWWNAAGAK